MPNDRGWYTSVYAAVLDSPEYMALSADGAAVWWALKLCPENNQLGVFPFFREQVAARAKVPLERVIDALRELETAKWIVIEERWVWLRNHLKFDPNYAPLNPKHVQGLLAKLSALPRIKLTAAFVKYYKGLSYIPIRYRYGIDRVSIPMPYGIDTVSIPVTDTETISVTDTETNNSVALVFDHWRTVMDHVDSKLTPDRSRCIKARLAEGATTQQLIEAIDGCKASAFHMGANDAGKVYDSVTLIFRNASKVDEFRGRRLVPRVPPSSKATARQDSAMALIRGGMSDASSVDQGNGDVGGDHEKPRLDAGDGDGARADLPPAIGSSQR